MTVHRSGSIGVINLCGEFDLSTRGAFADAVGQLLGEDPVARISIRADQLDFIDSSGLITLLAAQNSLRAIGVELRLEAVSTAARRVIDLAGVTEDLLPDDHRPD